MDIDMRKRGRHSDDVHTEAGMGKRAAASATVEYRLLCPAARIGTVIGKGGLTIQQMRDSTGARIKVEPEVVGCSDRLISFSSPDEPGADWCRAQEALFAVQGRLTEAEAPQEDSCCMVRMVIEHAQVGCVLGKGGEVISELRRRTGANIRVSDKCDRDLSGYAGSDDGLVTVKGEAEAVTDALKQLSALLRTHSQRKPQQARPLTFNITAVATSAVQPPQPQGRAPMCEPVLAQLTRPHQCHNCLPDSHALPPHITAREAAAVVEVQLRLLVPATHIGCIIGRRGDMIRSIRDDTGAHVKVHEGSQEKKGIDRVITVTAAEAAGAAVSPSEEAMCLMALCLLGPSGVAPVPSIRILVPTPQVGGVLGKGGATITQVRKESGASVRLIPLEAEDDRWLPRDVAAGQAHKVVQIEGQITAIVKALRAVCGHLRSWQARSQGAQPGSRETAVQHSSAHAPPCQQHHGYMVQQGTLQHDMARHLGVPDLARADLDMYDSPLRHSHFERPILQIRQSHDQCMGRGGLDRGPPPLAMQQLSQQGGAPPDQVQSRELRLVGVQVGCVLGKAGENITQIRKISGARVKLSDAPRGVMERLLRLSGSPEQVQAAVNLVQAFLLAGRAGSLAMDPPMAFA
ncbi:g8493 [Coccomyxa elongata]